MKKRPINILTGSLAAIGAALLAPSAHAANSYNVGDLFIGFEETGSSHNYIIDIGPASNYIGVTGSFNVNTTLGLGNIAADLANSTSGFGASWATNTGTNLLQWGVVGASSNAGNLTLGAVTLPKNTLFLSQGELVVGTPSGAPAKHTSGLQGTVNTNILNLENSYQGSAQTANSNFAEFQLTSDANNWSSFTPNNGGFGSSVNLEQPVSGSFTGPTNSRIDLFEIQPAATGSGTYLGYFALDSAANLTFTGAAAPEPTSAGLLAVGVGFLGFIRRRQPVAHS